MNHLSELFLEQCLPPKSGEIDHLRIDHVESSLPKWLAADFVDQGGDQDDLHVVVMDLGQVALELCNSFSDGSRLHSTALTSDRYLARIDEIDSIVAEPPQILCFLSADCFRIISGIFIQRLHDFEKQGVPDRDVFEVEEPP